MNIGLEEAGLKNPPENAVTEVPKEIEEGPAPLPLQDGKFPELDDETEQKIAAAERRYDGASAIAPYSCTKLTESQTADLSQRFTTLLRQKHDADKVLKELTPLEGGIQDHEALEGWVRMMNGKVEMISEEMKRLQDQIKRGIFRCRV